MKVLGIDPGLSGAIVSYDGEFICPLVIPTTKAKTRGREVTWPALALDFELLMADADHAFIEQVGAMPGQGVSSMFKFGYVAGGLRGLVAAAKIPVTMVTPQVWKRTMHVTSSKDVARARAGDIFPLQAKLFERKKDEGVAEAALIAMYGYCILNVGGKNGTA
jgi:crossover junction endodeoxyribonuclease RuvC